MNVCEECWANAFFDARLRGVSQVDRYHELLAIFPHGHPGEAGGGS